MLGTFEKGFPKQQLPKGIFPSVNFPNVLFPKWKLLKSVLTAALGPLSCSSHSARPRPPLQPAATREDLT